MRVSYSIESTPNSAVNRRLVIKRMAMALIPRPFHIATTRAPKRSRQATLAAFLFLSTLCLGTIFVSHALGGTGTVYVKNEASYIFQDGFESGDFSAWAGQSNPSYQSVQTATYHHNNDNNGAPYAAKWTNTPQYTTSYICKTFNTTHAITYTRFYVRFDSLPDASGDQVTILSVGKSSNWFPAVVYVRHDGISAKWRLGNRYFNTYQYAASGPTTGQWYCVELKATTTSNLILYVDGDEVASTLYGIIQSQDRIEIGAGRDGVNSGVVGFTYTAYFDCVALSDSYVGTSCGPTSEPALGTLRVMSVPVPGICSVNGTQWGLTPQSRNVTVGTYVAAWSPVDGYVTPGPQTVTVSANMTTIVTGTYMGIPPPSGKHRLSVYSSPCNSIPVQVVNATHSFTMMTGETILLWDGNYIVTPSENVKITSQIWIFEAWSDNNYARSREVFLGDDTILLCNYRK